MTRYMWKAHVLEGKLDEYIRRHDEIWPEMTQMLDDSGVRNYTIWNCGNELIGYYETDDIEKLRAIQASSEVNQRWQVSMQGVMEMDCDPVTGERVHVRQVFLHEGRDTRQPA